MLIGQALFEFLPRKWLHDKFFWDEGEYLESPNVSFHERITIVGELARANERSGFIKGMIREFESLLGDLNDWRCLNRPLRLLDIGPGGGALLKALHVWAGEHNLPVELYGVDIDSEFAEYIQKKLNAESIPVRIFHGDGADLRRFSENSFDFVFSSHVIHHIRDRQEVSQCFNEIFHMARYGWLIVDLDKRLIGPVFMKIACTINRCSKVLTQDGIKSARRAYSALEINRLLSNKQMHCSPHFAIPYWMVKGRKY